MATPPSAPSPFSAREEYTHVNTKPNNNTNTLHSPLILSSTTSGGSRSIRFSFTRNAKIKLTLSTRRKNNFVTRQKAAAQKTKQEDNKGADYRVNTKKLPAQKAKQELDDQPRAKATVEICAGEAEVAWGRSCVTKRRAKWGTQYIRTRLLTRVFRGHNTRFPLPKNSAVGREKTFAGVTPKKI